MCNPRASRFYNFVRNWRFSKDQIVITVLWVSLLAYLFTMYMPALYSVRMSSDIAIIVSFAERIMDGMTPLDGYYDPNPPLSFLIYIPVVWLGDYIGVAVYKVLFFYTFLWIAVSLFSVMCLLESLIPDHKTLRHFLGCLFTAGLVIVPGSDFGDRDHFVIIGLLPFLLMQIGYLQNVNMNRYITAFSLITGTLAVLIKPHYGLLPVCLMLWRAGRDRNFKSLFQADFFCLTAGVILYILICLIYFREYVFVVFVDVFGLYIPLRNPVVWPELMAYSILFGLCVYVTYESKAKLLVKHICCLLCMAGWLLLVVYVVQGKGLNYHRIPYLVFFFTACGVSLYVLLLKFKVREGISMPLSLVFTVLALLSLRGLPGGYITHDRFKEMPLSETLATYCENPCSYFLFHDTSELIHPLAIYHNAFHASRFTSLWFLPKILVGEKNGDPRALSLKKQYTSMIVDDFRKYKPDILIIMSGTGFQDISYEFIDYFSSDPDFRKEAEHYKRVDTISFNRNIYFPGTVSFFSNEPPVLYDVYKRQE